MNMKNKKFYAPAEAEIIVLATCDVMTLSAGGDGVDDDYNKVPGDSIFG